MIIAVGAGIRIGAAFFDLIPEAVEHLGSLEMAMLWTASGFLAFYAIEQVTTLHVGHETAAELDHDSATHQHLGVVGATGMGIHCFLDGVALAAGLASVAGSAWSSPRSSCSIASATASASCVPAGQPDPLVDGAALADPGRRWRRSRASSSARSCRVPDDVLGAILGFFAGFFLYVGAAELLPEAHRRDRSRWVALATIAGALGIYLFSVAVGAIGVDAH